MSSTPTKKRSGLVYANAYDQAGKCVGKKWMTPDEANLNRAANHLYKQFLAEKSAKAAMVIPDPPSRWQMFKAWIQMKFQC